MNKTTVHVEVSVRFIRCIELLNDNLCLLFDADIASKTGIHVDDVRNTLKCLDVVTSPVIWYSLLYFFVLYFYLISTVSILLVDILQLYVHLLLADIKLTRCRALYFCHVLSVMCVL